jgi:hypothetical protein
MAGGYGKEMVAIRSASANPATVFGKLDPAGKLERIRRSLASGHQDIPADQVTWLMVNLDRLTGLDVTSREGQAVFAEWRNAAVYSARAAKRPHMKLADEDPPNTAPGGRP